MTTSTEPTFVRRLGLLLTNNAGDLIDLSQARVTFRIEAADVDHPNSATIRVHNLKPDTMNKIIGEFQQVTLQAGYVSPNPFGVIFAGTIKQFRKGKSDAVTSYLDILAADGDVAYNNSFISRTLAAGHTPETQVDAALAAMNIAQKQAFEGGANLPDITLSTPLNQLPGGVLPAKRGKVMFGMARDVFKQAAARLQCSWSIQNGRIQVIPYDSYLTTSTIIQLSQFTGLIGIPEATDQGVKIKTLLNPNIVVGCLVQIDESLINQTIFASGNSAQVPYNQYTGVQLIANTSRDGFYRVYVVEYEGDTRGQPWYCNLICLAIDPSAHPRQLTPRDN
jgi:hypothetical protein